MAGTFGAVDTLDLIIRLPLEHSIMLIADHGMGKSQVVLQAAMTLNIPCIDFRLSQNDVGDLKGLPFHVKGRTVFAPPEFMPLSEGDLVELGELLGHDNMCQCKYGNAGILFLDELNRADTDVENAAFELVLDRRLNLRSLPPGWRVVAAINGNTEVYNKVNSTEVALSSRFFAIDFKPTHEEFLNHMKKKEIHPSILSLLEQRNDLIDPSQELLKKAAVEGFMKVHDRRAWEKLSEVIQKFEKDHEECTDGSVRDILDIRDSKDTYLKQLSRGWVGSYAGDEYYNYVRTQYRVFDGNKILNHWNEEIKVHIEKLATEGALATIGKYNKMIVQWIFDNTKRQLSEEQSENLYQYLSTIPREVRGNFWPMFDRECKAIADTWLDTSEKHSDLMLSALMAHYEAHKTEAA